MIPDVACVLVEGGRETPVYRGAPGYDASLEWARFHGIDPNTIPAGAKIVRDPGRCRVLYESFVYDPPESFPHSDGIVVAESEPVRVSRIAQGEAPPLPFPESSCG
jgi:hypothetical protein